MNGMHCSALRDFGVTKDLPSNVKVKLKIMKSF